MPEACTVVTSPLSASYPKQVQLDSQGPLQGLYNVDVVNQCKLLLYKT